MKKVVFLAAMCVAALALGCAGERPGTVYQVSTMQALMEGAYDGTVTLGELKRHGDAGIGTFDALDGEMIVLDGQVYQARADGQVVRPPDSLTTPFADVTFFKADKVARLGEVKDLPALQAALDAAVGSRNLFYAVRIDARFASVKVRAVPAQKPPYPGLAEVTRQQKVYELNDVEGTLIALRVPEYARGVNLAGWHVHFLSRDRTRGGHVLGVRMGASEARIDRLERFLMVLPSSGRFVEADLTRDTEAEMRKAEQ